MGTSLKHARNTNGRVLRSAEERPDSLKCRTYGLVSGEEPSHKPSDNSYLTPVSDLDLMIEMGWGDTPQREIPSDWRTRRKGRARR